MSKIAVARAASLERKLLKAYASVELVTKIECYFDDSAKSIVVHAEFGDEREINEYLGDNTRAWTLYVDGKIAIDAEIEKMIAEVITPEQRAADAQRDSAAVAAKHAELAAPVELLPEAKVFWDAQAAGYAPISEEELQQTLDAVTTEGEHHFTESGSIINGLQRIADDIDALPALCPRCGINELHEEEVWNARSKYAPIYICPPCGTHESLSAFGADLWNDQESLRIALQKQRESRAAADAVLQQSIERARQARAQRQVRAERQARETLCELAPSQTEAMRAAVVWP